MLLAPKSMEEKLLRCMERHFGFHSFRENQLEIMMAILDNHDVFVRKPTGGGKSLLYSLPCLVRKGLAIVVSPLIALIQDQAEKLSAANIPNKAIHGSLDGMKRTSMLVDLELDKDDTKIVIMTPEQFVSGSFTRTMEKLYQAKRILYVAVDEAHYVEQWSVLRHSYTMIGEQRRKIPGVPFVAVTATATSQCQKNILKSLKMPLPSIFVETINRNNIKISVVPKCKESVIRQIFSIVQRDFQGQAGLIYLQTIGECKLVGMELKRMGLKAELYFSSLPLEQKQSNQSKWMDGTIDIIVSTNAFGAGIDKNNVRYVIHGTLPNSIEDYVQQTGRVGRDGKRSHAILLYSPRDIKRAMQLVAPDSKQDNFQAEEVLRLHHLQDYLEAPVECRKSLILRYFGESPDDCAVLGGQICDNCANASSHTAVDVSKETTCIVDDLGLTGFYDKSTIVEALKGTKKPSASCQFVGLMRHWPTPEIERFIRHLCRMQILRHCVKLHPVTKRVAIDIHTGANSGCARSEPVTMTFSTSVFNDIDQSDRDIPPETDAILRAGTKFISPPKVQDEAAATKPLTGMDFRCCF